MILGMLLSKKDAEQCHDDIINVQGNEELNSKVMMNNRWKRRFTSEFF